MSEKELLELVKSYLNNEYITKATFDFENNCINLTIVPPVTLERIRIECIIEAFQNDKENQK